MTTDYEAIVYDLDGTLVSLDVDWEATRRDAAAALRSHGWETDGMGLWEVLRTATGTDARPAVESAIAEHECDGARTGAALPLADELPLAVPVGVCSLNCEDACQIALRTHGLAEHVDVVTGRDTHDTYKPDPEPLLRTVRALDASPERALFVGDGERDERTAERAGVPFRYVADRLADRDA